MRPVEDAAGVAMVTLVSALSGEKRSEEFAPQNDHCNGTRPGFLHRKEVPERMKFLGMNDFTTMGFI